MEMTQRDRLEKFINTQVIIDELRQTDSVLPGGIFFWVGHALHKKEHIKGMLISSWDEMYRRIQRTSDRLLEPSGVIYDKFSSKPDATIHVVSLGTDRISNNDFS